MVLAVASYVTRSVGVGQCRDETIAELPSSDGRIVASTVQRKCGVFSGDSMLVVMRFAAQPESADEYASVVIAEGPCALRTVFVADTLTVAVPSSCEVEQRADEWNGVTIQLSQP